MAIVNSTGLVEAEPASMNDMFMSEPKNAAKPVSAPSISPTPTAISPATTRTANQSCAPLSIRYWMKSRYQS